MARSKLVLLSALVVSPTSYNGKIGRMLCGPMTTSIKGYPF